MRWLVFIFLWEQEVVGVYIPLGTRGGWCLYSSGNMRWLVFIFLWEHEVVGVYIPLGA